MFGLFYLPDVAAVPVERAVEGGPLFCGRDYWLVNGVERVIERACLEGLAEFGRGTGAEHINEGEEKEDHEGQCSSASLGLSKRWGRGLVVTQGDGAHDKNVRLRMTFGMGRLTTKWGLKGRKRC